MKLYVIVSQTLSTPQKAVQGGHAIADFMIRNPESQWRGHSLIFLTVPTDEDSGTGGFYFLTLGSLRKFIIFLTNSPALTRNLPTFVKADSSPELGIIRVNPSTTTPNPPRITATELRIMS